MMKPLALKSLNSESQPLLDPLNRWPRIVDAIIAIVVFLAYVFLLEDAAQNFTVSQAPKFTIAVYVIFAVSSGALYWRRRRPLVVLAVTLAAATLTVGHSYSSDLFGLPVALYSVGRYVTNDRWSYLGVGAGCCQAVINDLVIDVPTADITSTLIVLVLVWYMGNRVQIRGDYMVLLQERNEQLDRQQSTESRRAVAEERTRIARELHDVVAHQVSLMTVQTGAAKTVVTDDPQRALQAMEAVEKAGRQALDELRHLMGVLRPASANDGPGPQPGLSDLPELVEHLGEAGSKVALTMDGTWSDLPARVDLSAYRIVQEALTNVLKHAGPEAQATVRIINDDNEVVIEVRDNGLGLTMSTESGHGIAGMRERAQLLGGSLEARPRPDVGFQVIAHLPVSVEPV